MAAVHHIHAQQPEPLRPPTLDDFAFMRADLRPSRVDATVQPATPLQTDAWRRLGALINDLTTQRVLLARADAPTSEER